MPHCTVTVADDALAGAEAPLTAAITDAITSVCGEWARPLADVRIIGVPRARIGVGGAPATRLSPVVTLTSRERLFEAVEDASARLITAFTEAVVGVFGEEVRGDVVVTLVGEDAA